jgi:uridylate kinase
VLIALVIGIAMLFVMFSSIGATFAVSGTVGAVIGGIFGVKLYRKYIDAVDEMEKTLSEWMGMMGLLVCVL